MTFARSQQNGCYTKLEIFDTQSFQIKASLDVPGVHTGFHLPRKQHQLPSASSLLTRHGF